jgi:hypothetical protein
MSSVFCTEHFEATVGIWSRSNKKNTDYSNPDLNDLTTYSGGEFLAH